MTSIFFLCLGCITLRRGDEWISPPKPSTNPVVIVAIKEADIQADGFYLDRQSAIYLAENIDALKAYVKKLELKIEKMNEYYGGK